MANRDHFSTIRVVTEMFYSCKHFCKLLEFDLSDMSNDKTCCLWNVIINELFTICGSSDISLNIYTLESFGGLAKYKCPPYLTFLRCSHLLQLTFDHVNEDIFIGRFK